MPRAPIPSHEERLAMTRKHSTLLQDIREEKDLPPPFPGAEETNAQIENDGVHCPYCGAELRHVGGCLECPNRDYSVCG